MHSHNESLLRQDQTDSFSNPLRRPMSPGEFAWTAQAMFGPKTGSDTAFYPRTVELSPTVVGMEISGIIRRHVDAESTLISQALNLAPYQRSLIELCAGNGQFLRRSYWHPFFRIHRYLGIEIDPIEVARFHTISHFFQKAQIIQGDAMNAASLLKDHEVGSPVIAILQNSLGTIRGNHSEVLEQMKFILHTYPDASAIISLYRKQALEDWGLLSYWYGAAVNGWPYDQELLSKGIFKSPTGYESKWWSNAEIADIVDFFGGRLTTEIVQDEFWVGLVGG